MEKQKVFGHSFPCLIKWTVSLLQRMSSVWNYRRHNKNTVELTSEFWTCKNSTLKNQHIMALFTHLHLHTYTNVQTYTQKENRVLYIYFNLFVASVFSCFCSFVFFFFGTMFVAFSTVELALTCYTHLYIFYFLFLVCLL